MACNYLNKIFIYFVFASFFVIHFNGGCIDVITPFTPTTQRDIVLSRYQYLPNIPSQMSTSDKNYFMTASSWNVKIAKIPSGLTADEKKLLERFMNTLRYVVLTRQFADSIISKGRLGLGYLDNASRPFYEGTNTDAVQSYRVTPLEIVVACRTMNYTISFFKRMDVEEKFKADLGYRGTFNLGSCYKTTSTYTILDSMKASNYVRIYFPSIDLTTKFSRQAGMLLHEMTHNWGYAHLSPELVQLNPESTYYKDVPYGVQDVIYNLNFDIKRGAYTYDDAYDKGEIPKYYDFTNTQETSPITL